MTTLHNIIVPGVGGSNEYHWQSWLETRLTNCSRVQQDWENPILNQWVEQWVQTIQAIDTKASLQIIAHSFGCLTSIAALNKYPEICARVKNLVLVAPANPVRFSEIGFSQHSDNSYFETFKELRLSVPTKMIISENDPWLSFADATYFATLWNVPTINLGQVGHINVDSGFGAFPEITPYLLLSSKERMFERTSSLLLKNTQRQFLAQSGL